MKNRAKKFLLFILTSLILVSCIEPEKLESKSCDPADGCIEVSDFDSDSEVITCKGSSITYATLCDGDTSNLVSSGTFHLVSSCSSAKCEFVCNSGYEPNPTMNGCTEIAEVPVQTEPSDLVIATKNYLQINNSFSSLTGVPTDHDSVEPEYNAILMQLPSTSNPEALNGFNQIAQTRLAFAYCDVYMDNNFNSIYMNLSNSNLANRLLDTFTDVDYNSNAAHVALRNNVLEVLSDSDNLISDGNATSKKRKLSKMACAAILASAYVTMI